MRHNKKKIIAITGGIASGKSTVSLILKERGFKLVDADQISKEIMEEDRDLCYKLIDYFGKEILSENFQIDRKKLGNIIFKNPRKRKKLEDLIHPKILKKIEEIIARSQDKLVFVDIPLLYEIKDKIDEYSIYFSEIWLVYVNYSTQLERLMKRDNISKNEAKRKIEAQISLEEKVKKADLIIDNNGDRVELEKQVEKLIEDIKL